jgi:hypothetical protein
MAIQCAIWHFCGINSAIQSDAQALVDAANANGDGYISEKWVAVLLVINDNTQLTFIEVDP